jgi:ribosome biogenesis protein ERB1
MAKSKTTTTTTKTSKRKRSDQNEAEQVPALATAPAALSVQASGGLLKGDLPEPDDSDEEGLPEIALSGSEAEDEDGDDEDDDSENTPDEEEDPSESDSGSDRDDQDDFVHGAETLVHVPFPVAKVITSTITGQPKRVYPEIEPDYDSDSSTEDVRKSLVHFAVVVERELIWTKAGS